MLYFEYTIPSALLMAALAVIMLVYNWKSNKAIVYLFAFLILHSAYGIIHTLLAFGDPKNETTIFFTTILLNNTAPLWWLRGPFLFFYVRSVVHDRLKFKKTDWLHFLPFAVNFAAVVPYLFTSWDFKESIARSSIGSVSFVLNYNYELFYPHMLNNYLRPVQLLLYIVVSVYLLARFYPQIKRVSDETLSKQYRMVFYWLSGLLFLLLGNTLFINYITFEFFRAPFDNHLSASIQNIYSLSYALFTALPLLILAFPKITYGMPQWLSVQKTSPATEDPIGSSGPKDVVVSTQAKSTKYDEEHFEKLSVEIIDYLNHYKPYLDPDFSLHELSLGVNAPQHHLRYCLGVVMKKSFSDLKNEMRIKHAIHLLEASATEKISIDGIGRQSGFKSPSNFYAIFKEKTGSTPSEWLKKKENC
jgi:AraC-like DNA-binding protein